MIPPGRRKLAPYALLPLLFLLFLATTTHAASAVLGIDLGTEYLKAAIARPGSPIEIVLSKDSKRKETATLAFKPSRAQDKDNDAFPERLYGGDAAALSARFPSDVYPNLKSLLGVEYSAPAVKTYAARYPGLNIEAVPRGDATDEKAGTVGFKSQSFRGKEEVFMVEELLAMELKNVRSNAEAMLAKGVYVTNVVITHPSFYTAEEKRAIELAADLAGLRILGLVSDGLAVGLNYATHRSFESVTDGAKPEYHLIYDMGAGSTTATVLKFQGRTIKGPSKRNSTVQEVIALGTGFDATLGGDSLNDVIVDDIVAQFVESPKVKKLGLTTGQVRANGKAMARIWKEAERIRQFLSANAASGATFDGLYDDDIVFKYSLTRDKFEELTAEFAARVRAPVDAAVQFAGLQLDDLDSIILHGGAVRTPFVQKQLDKVAVRPAQLKSNVNADEAAVMGAAFKAASLSPSFRVKDIRDTDISSFSFMLKWSADNKEKSQKLFTPSSQVGVEKQVPIKTLEDVTLSFSQAVEDSDVVILQVEALNLTKSVAELQEKHRCSASNISTVFTVRLSPVDALPEVTTGSVNCEVESTKGGTVMDNVKGLFGFGKKENDQKLVDTDDAVEDTSESLTPLPVSDPTSSGSTISSASPSPAESSGVSSSLSSSTKAVRAVNAAPSVASVPLSLKSTVVGLNSPPSQTLPRLRQRLSQFDASDRNAVLRAEALNTLEAFTYRARDYLDDESFIAASSDSARKELQKQLTSISEWLYGEGVDAKVQDFKDKLKSLRDLVDPVLKRRDESTKRPDAVKALKEGLENLNGMITMVEGSIKRAAEDASSSASEAASSPSSSASASSSSSVAEGDDLDDDPYSSTPAADAARTDEAPAIKPYEYTNEDLSTLTTKYDEVKKWLDEKLALQDKLGQHDDPAFLVSELESRAQELQRLVSETIMKTIKMQDMPRKGKASGSKKGAKGKPKKSKSTSTGPSSPSGTNTSTPATSAGSSTVTISAPTATKSVKDEL
ncbi:putative Hsp70 family chaperone Lhs1/Orp150 [Cladophialophora carrionii]|uniref:Putative Hsp70 family chaperone Lhs1/Orp150 n=1 Tax=Cladophialophora carrionii TaxID=86049 RepID=A0A1C1CQT3_9EURO|nr:putative Hsp70 family chaperone Lhs1/Orp150 [Cladophialophora carrionii]